MTRSQAKSALTEYELAVDEIIADHDGDVRGALKALMTLNDFLESKLEEMSAILIGRKDREAHHSIH